MRGAAAGQAKGGMTDHCHLTFKIGGLGVQRIFSPMLRSWGRCWEDDWGRQGSKSAFKCFYSTSSSAWTVWIEFAIGRWRCNHCASRSYAQNPTGLARLERLLLLYICRMLKEDGLADSVMKVNESRRNHTSVHISTSVSRNPTRPTVEVGCPKSWESGELGKHTSSFCSEFSQLVLWVLKFEPAFLATTHEQT